MTIPMKLGGVLLTLLVLNYAFAALFGFAPVYCIGRAVLAPLLAWLTFVNLALGLLAWMAAAMGKRDLAIELVLGLILLNALPSIASSAFGLGTTCGLPRQAEAPAKVPVAQNTAEHKQRPVVPETASSIPLPVRKTSEVRRHYALPPEAYQISRDYPNFWERNRPRKDCSLVRVRRPDGTIPEDC